MKYPSLQHGHTTHMCYASTSFSWAHFWVDCNSPYTPSTAAVCLLSRVSRIRKVGLWIRSAQWYIEQWYRWSLPCSTAAQRLFLPRCGHELLWVRDLTSLLGLFPSKVLYKAVLTLCIIYSARLFDGDILNEWGFWQSPQIIRNVGLLLDTTGPGNSLVTPDREETATVGVCDLDSF